MRLHNAFTLIEMIIVIALIALISTIGIASFNRIQTQSRTTKLNADLANIQKNINAARFVSNQTLAQITGSTWSEGFNNACLGAGDLRNVPDTHLCVVRWRNVQNRLAQFNADISDIDRDPWGNPYTVDENDGVTATCIRDIIRSPGPDGIAGNSDDIIIRLSMVTTGC